ncbi:MAG: hypothetical protein EBZ67_10220, partial [Chitinophagia bacterium]|nr:hypothetical protein [Chitinophagia bacterium]
MHANIGEDGANPLIWWYFYIEADPHLTHSTAHGPARYSQGRAMLAIARASLLSILRSPSSIVFGVLFPFIF